MPLPCKSLQKFPWNCEALAGNPAADSKIKSQSGTLKYKLLGKLGIGETLCTSQNNVHTKTLAFPSVSAPWCCAAAYEGGNGGYFFALLCSLFLSLSVAIIESLRRKRFVIIVVIRFSRTHATPAPGESEMFTGRFHLCVPSVAIALVGIAFCCNLVRFLAGEDFPLVSG